MKQEKDISKFENASNMSQKDNEEFSKMVVDNISRMNSQYDLEGMNFNSPSNKISWFKILKMKVKQKTKSRIDYIMEESMSDKGSNTSVSDLSSVFIKEDLRPSTSNTQIAKSKFRQISSIAAHDIKGKTRAKTARKTLPSGYLQCPVVTIKTPYEMNESQMAWNKKVTRDSEYWHMKKQAYNGIPYPLNV